MLLIKTLDNSEKNKREKQKTSIISHFLRSHYYHYLFLKAHMHLFIFKHKKVCRKSKDPQLPHSDNPCRYLKSNIYIYIYILKIKTTKKYIKWMKNNYPFPNSFSSQA